MGMSRRPSILTRLLRRSGPKESVDRNVPPAEPTAAGPRREDWLVVGCGTSAKRSSALARGLAERGHQTTFVARDSTGRLPDTSERLRVLERWSLPALRSECAQGVDRLRVLLGVADAETIALARDLAGFGARVAYDAPAPSGPPRGPLSYDAQTERALVDTVEDLVGADSRAARHLLSVAGGGRLVHVVPDAEDAPGWGRSAGILVDLAARPSTTVLLVTATDAEQTLAAVSAFESARADGAYRLAVVAGVQDPASDALDVMEEEGRIALFRSARPGRAAAWNLGLSATRSEFVALVHASQRPDGARWLVPAIEALAAGRELGAVGLKARLPPSALGERRSRLGEEALRVAALDGLGLVAPRSVLRRAGGFDEKLEPGGLSAIDLSFRIRDLGLAVALCPALGLRGGEGESQAPSPATEKALRRRWSHRRAYLDGLV